MLTALAPHLPAAFLPEVLTSATTRTIATCGCAEFLRSLAALMQSHLRLGVMMATRYRDGPIELLDLIQWANLGLMEAAKRWHPERGTFATYAVYCIRSKISRAFRVLLA